jgi:adenine specific DNA methylase Mod
MKMKLNQEQKVFRKRVKRIAEERGAIFQVNEYGDTFLFIPQGTRTAILSVALLNPADTYNRKYGEFVALEKWYSGDSILVPFGVL